MSCLISQVIEENKSLYTLHLKYEKPNKNDS